MPRRTRIEELESAVRACCEPFFDRPLKEISLGLVLMRLFQASRRFDVEIQPQLVLLQKTLLNIEGLGRQLDPDLDLWVTAKPFLERWMIERIGPAALKDRLEREATQWAQTLPQIPRLLHAALARRAAGQDPLPEWAQALVTETRQTRRWLSVAAGALAVLATVAVGLLAMVVMHSTH